MKAFAAIIYKADLHVNNIPLMFFSVEVTVGPLPITWDLSQLSLRLLNDATTIKLKCCIKSSWKVTCKNGATSSKELYDHSGYTAVYEWFITALGFKTWKVEQNLNLSKYRANQLIYLLLELIECEEEKRENLTQRALNTEMAANANKCTEFVFWAPFSEVVIIME